MEVEKPMSPIPCILAATDVLCFTMNSSDLSEFSTILNSTSIQDDDTPQLFIPDLSDCQLPSTISDDTPQLFIPNLSDCHLPPAHADVKSAAVDLHHLNSDVPC